MIRFLDEPLSFQHGAVVGVVVGDAHRGHKFKAFDKNANAAGTRKAACTQQAGELMLPAPILAGAGELLDDLGVFDKVKVIEKTSRILMVVGELAVVQHSSSAKNLSAAFDDKKVGGGMLVEGVLTAVELSFLIGTDGGNPIGGFAVEVKGELDELGTVAFVFGVQFSDFHFTLGEFSGAADGIRSSL